MSARPRPGTAAVWMCALYAIATSGWYVVWRHFFAERSADEGMFENILWNALHGGGLRTWIEGGVPHLAVHFSPVLYLLLPLYALFPSMHVVHFTASALTGVAGVVFYRHTARSLDERSALFATAAFLLCPTIVLQTFMEFHEQALAILPLTLLLVSWREARTARMLWSALALLCVREDNALLVMALGGITLFEPRRRGAAVALLALGLGWLAAWRALVIPMLGGGGLPDLLGNTYTAWGTSPGGIARAVLSRPLDVVRHVLAPVPVKYLVLLFVPVLGVLPFGSRLALVMVPQLAMVLLADHGSRMFQIRMHYSIAPAVVALFASVATLARLDAARPGPEGWLRRWAPLAMMVVGLVLVPGWGLRAITRLNPWSAEIREVLSAVPERASVAAPGYLLNHLAARRRIALVWREELPGTEFVVLEDSSRFFLNTSTVDAFWTPSFDSLLAAGGYTRRAVRHGWHVYRQDREASGAPPR